MQKFAEGADFKTMVNALLKRAAEEEARAWKRFFRVCLDMADEVDRRRAKLNAE